MKKLIFLCMMISCSSVMFAQKYAQYISEARKYEDQKRWCYAMGAYFDAVEAAESLLDKQEASKKYDELKDVILDGNPGFGKFNDFTFHDEWKRLLIDAEKYGSSFSKYDIITGELNKGDLDYATRTASYSAKIRCEVSKRYEQTIDVVAKGYAKAHREDWKDLPEDWPHLSASYNNDGVYNVNGAFVLAFNAPNYFGSRMYYLNCFNVYYEEFRTYNYYFNTNGTNYFPGCFDYKLNIVDEGGREIVKGTRWLLGDGDTITFTGVAPEAMEIIDDGKAYINPVACYIQYGAYDPEEDNVREGRSFIKKLPEMQISLNKSRIISEPQLKAEQARIEAEQARLEAEQLARIEAERARLEAEEQAKIEAERLKKLKRLEECQKNLQNAFSLPDPVEQIKKLMVKIPGVHCEILATEVTQKMYQSVMAENPSNFKGDNLPVENVSYFDAIYFCNLLSEKCGYAPVYSVDGNTDVKKWNYKPHQGKSISGKISQNINLNGFRLPKIEEWQHAAKAGEDYTYAGSNNIEEVAWYAQNSGDKSHPVGQKIPNGYGLYDMSGNVAEWVSGQYYCGGGWDDFANACEVGSRNSYYAYSRYYHIGFRLVRSSF